MTVSTSSNATTGTTSNTIDGNTIIANNDKNVGSTNLTVRRSQTIYHPVVSLMVDQNLLSDCYQIRDMYSQCLHNKFVQDEESFICHTAKKYHAMCLQRGGERSQ